MRYGGGRVSGGKLWTSRPPCQHCAAHHTATSLPPASHLLQPVSQPPVLILGTVTLQLGAVCEGGQHTLLG